MADFSQNKKYNYNWQSSKFKNLALSGSYISQFINDAGYVTSSTAVSASYATSASYALTASYLTGTITSASYAQTASYATDFIVSRSISGVDYIDFDITATGIQPSLARLSWNQTDKTLEIGTGDGDTTLQIGQETVYPPVVNKDSINLGEGTLVMVDPTDIAQGNRIRVVRMVADGTYPSQYMVGVLTEDIAKNQEGFATWFGYVRNLNIPTLEANGIKPVGESWVEGDVLFPNPTTPGGLTFTQPTAPSIDATIAVITAINGNNLTMLVRPTLTITVGELNNVSDNTTTGSYGDLLFKSGSVWTTGKQLTGSYGLTGSLTATSFTGSLQGTASYALTASYVAGASSFPYTGDALISGSLTVTGSIYTDSTIYSPFTIGLNFETPTSYTYKTPYSFKVNSIEADPSGSLTIIYQASGSTEITASYVIGNNINKFDKLIITPATASLIVLNSTRI